MQEQTVNHKQTVRNLEIIFDNSKKSKLDYSDKTVYDAIRMTAECFEITHIQACLFAIIFMHSIDDSSIETERLIKFLDLNITDFFDLQGDLEILLSKNLIRLKRENGWRNLYNATLIINPKVIDAIFNCKSIQEVLKEPELDIPQFCTHISRTIKSLVLRNYSLCDITEKVGEIENRNSNLEIIGQLRQIITTEQDRIILYDLICNLTSTNESSADLQTTLDDLFGRRESGMLLREYINNETEIHKNGFIGIDALGFADDATISITPKATSFLLGDSAHLYTKRITNYNLIKHDNIFPKVLYFDLDIKRELTLLEDSIKGDNFITLQQNLRSKGFQNNGVTAILYGVSGGGKTSGVYQIARKTKRDILQLDLSEVRSKYYGESEKQVKEIFNQYRDLCKASEQTPILLLNECDAVLGKRMECSSTTDMTETTLVNLFLEFFETNTGIVIATTNLIDNIDSSFLRRFLFKVKFSSPSPFVIKQILGSKLDFLSEKELDIISNKYRITGGEIDNITIKVALNQVFTKSNPTLHEIMEYCEHEKVRDYKTSKLGF